MATTYVTTDGDMIDWICWRHPPYAGRMKGTVEAVFEANRFLENYGPVLPGGLTLVLPDPPPPPAATATVFLWS
ncbi:MAG TPA: tail protein X [Hyphomicrobiales bacterium]|nr:tail protein X [Hyphomicrobiales bacterium]